MKKALVVLFAVLFVGIGASSSSALTIDLFEGALNVDGTISSLSGFDYTVGTGTITATVTGVGEHNVIAFFDYEIDEVDNTYFNEYGVESGLLAAGQSWEIDEPGFVFGDIYTNFAADTLDNSNGVPSSVPDDVSMALGWNFTLAAGETAYIDFLIGTSTPSGFYLAQTDPDSPDSPATIYFSSTLDISGGGSTSVPEPGTLLLLATGLVGLAGLSRRRIKA